MVVAAFCLYHSPSPSSVITEITRCLLPGGMAIFAVKSADSYPELDQLVAGSGLDPAATSRPSLYQAAHSGNITELAAASLSVRQVIHETHRFTFPALADVAEYLATSPKYDLPPALAGSPAALATALRQRIPDAPVTATSVVTYLVALRPRAGTAMSRPFVKHYPSSAARQAAEDNYRWLAGLGSRVRLPALTAASGPVLCFERIEGRCARPEDLVMLAAHLGDVHGSAHVAELHQARLNQPYRAARGHMLPSFPHRRVDAVARELRAGNVPGEG